MSMWTRVLVFEESLILMPFVLNNFKTISDSAFHFHSRSNLSSFKNFGNSNKKIAVF